jgi:hypothetical protein
LQEVFLSKANSIPTENNVLEAGAPNIDGILERYLRFSNQLNRPICNQETYLHLGTPKLQ